MQTFKCSFIKFKKGQTFFERSLTYDQLVLLLILCDELKVVRTKKNRGKITFIFHKAEFNTYCEVKNLKDYILKKFVPETEWNK